MKDKELKFWCGGTEYTDYAKQWPSMTIAAYSQRDAAQLYVEVGGGERGALTHVRDFMGNAGGESFHQNVPNPSRGVYFYDDGRGEFSKREGRFLNRHARKREGWAVMFIPPKSRSIVEDIPEDAKAAAAGQPIPEDYGRLHVGFERGVKIDTWKFSSPHSDRALGDQMTAEVRMERVRREGRSGPAMMYGNGIEFVARSKCFEQLSHPNIERLYEMVQEAFRTYEIAQRGVVWEDWLKIEVHRHNLSAGDREDGVTGSGFEVRYEIIKRGIDPRSGRALTIHKSNDVVTDFPKPKAPGKPKRKAGDDDDDDWNWGDDHQIAFLPATPENIAALDKIIGAIDGARAKLELILAQANVQNTLASIPVVPLLERKDG